MATTIPGPISLRSKAARLSTAIKNLNVLSNRRQFYSSRLCSLSNAHNLSSASNRIPSRRISMQTSQYQSRQNLGTRWRSETQYAEFTLKRSFSSNRMLCKENTVPGTISTGAEGDTAAVVTSLSEELLPMPDHLNEAESGIYKKLSSQLSPTKLEVQDISGGCGSMYGIEIVSEKFRGLSMLKQQRLVNQVLGEEIKGWHGVQLKTRAP